MKINYSVGFLVKKHLLLKHKVCQSGIIINAILKSVLTESFLCVCVRISSNQIY